MQLNTTAACVLGLLQLGPIPGMERTAGPDAMTAWQVYSTAADSVARFWNITRSQVYRELGSLAGAGLVEESAAPSPRARRAYRITEAGRQAFREWLDAWAAQEPRDEQLHSPLVLTVFFGGSLPPDHLRRMLQDYRSRYERRLARTHEIMAFIAPEDSRLPPTQVLRRGMAYNEMMLRWLDELIDDETN